MEECQIEDVNINLPLDLCENVDLFKEVFSADTWQTAFTPAEKQHLEQFLPPGDSSDKMGSLEKLFNFENMRFGNPLEAMFSKLKSGLYSPECVKILKVLRRAKMRDYKYQQQQYYQQLLRDLAVSTSAASGSPPPLRLHSLTRSSNKLTLRHKTKRRYLNELSAISKDAGESSSNSDDDSYADCSSRSLHKKPRTQAWSANELLPSTLNLDEEAGSRRPFTQAVCKTSLSISRKKRENKQLKSEQGVRGLKGQPLLLDRNQVNKVKMPMFPPPPVLSESDSDDAEQRDAEQDMTGELTQETHASFFSLLRDMFLSSPDQKLSKAVLQESVKTWLDSPISALNDWYLLSRSWFDNLQYGINFLCGKYTDIQPEDFVPYIERKSGKVYQWIGAGRDSDNNLSLLSSFWLEHLDELRSVDAGGASSDHEGLSESNWRPSSPPRPRVTTDWVVRPSLQEEKQMYWEQERRRYSQPQKAFVFFMHGYESVVPPVKGVYNANSSNSKTRKNHSLLVPDRPPYVTLLTLVRDAVARLPNGEGTRNDICELLKDSQYLNATSDSSLLTVVSSALDRLHGEPDPCVRYQPTKKTWLYLHRHRSLQQFEELHYQQSLASKQKKAAAPRTPKNATKVNKVKEEKEEPLASSVTTVVPPQPTTSTATTSQVKLDTKTLQALSAGGGIQTIETRDPSGKILKTITISPKVLQTLKLQGIKVGNLVKSNPGPSVAKSTTTTTLTTPLPSLQTKQVSATANNLVSVASPTVSPTTISAGPKALGVKVSSSNVTQPKLLTVTPSPQVTALQQKLVGVNLPTNKQKATQPKLLSIMPHQKVLALAQGAKTQGFQLQNLILPGLTSAPGQIQVKSNVVSSTSNTNTTGAAVATKLITGAQLGTNQLVQLAPAAGTTTAGAPRLAIMSPQGVIVPIQGIATAATQGDKTLGTVPAVSPAPSANILNASTAAKQFIITKPGLSASNVVVGGGRGTVILASPPTSTASHPTAGVRLLSVGRPMFTQKVLTPSTSTGGGTT